MKHTKPTWAPWEVDKSYTRQEKLHPTTLRSFQKGTLATLHIEFSRLRPRNLQRQTGRERGGRVPVPPRSRPRNAAERELQPTGLWSPAARGRRGILSFRGLHASLGVFFPLRQSQEGVLSFARIGNMGKGGGEERKRYPCGTQVGLGWFQACGSKVGKRRICSLPTHPPQTP